MAIESRSVHLRHMSGKTAEGVFLFDPDTYEDVYRLILQFADDEYAAQADDLFEAMRRIRKQLEPQGWQAVCNGASRNVFPSGMSRDMGRGLTAYRLRLGVAGKMSDLVDIFDCAHDVEPASVEEQREFFDQWLKSLHRGT